MSLKTKFITVNCECGYHSSYLNNSSDAGYEKGRHTLAHNRWEKGIKIPKNFYNGEGLFVINCDNPMWMRRLAYDMSLLPKRENGYDVASFCYPFKGRCETECYEQKTQAFIPIRGGYAVGYVVIREVNRWAIWDGIEEGGKLDIIDYDYKLPRIDMIFTCSSFRRKGIMKSLLKDISARYHLKVEHFVWRTRFSDAGLRFVKGLGIKKILLG